MTKIGEVIAAFAGKLFNVFKIGAATIVSRVLASFGLATISINSVLPDLKGFLVQYTTALPASATQFMSAIGLDIFMTMILSALTVRLAWKVFIVPKSVADGLGGHP